MYEEGGACGTISMHKLTHRKTMEIVEIMTKNTPIMENSPLVSLLLETREIFHKVSSDHTYSCSSYPNRVIVQVV